MLFQSIDQIGERLGRKSYRHKPVAGLDQDTWSFGIGTVDNVVIFDRAGMQPKTAKGVHRGVAGNDPGLWRSIKAFSQVFHIPLRVPGWVIRQLQPVVGQLSCQLVVVNNIDEILPVENSPGRAGMTGNKAIGAKINYKLNSISSVLMSGDQVEIITSDIAKPEKEWLSFVRTSKAKEAIKAALKTETTNRIQKGMEILEEKLKELKAVYGEYEKLSDEKKALMYNEYIQIKRRYEKLATVKDIVDHIDHVVQVAGIDYVGIGTDFDGGGGVEGCKSVAEIRNITIELLRRGYSKSEISKIWGGNIMRVLKEAGQGSKT